MAASVLNPWFVVQRLDANSEMEFFTAVEGKDTFTKVKGTATLFMNLNSAARTAKAEVAQIRALVSKEETEEFGRG